MKAGDSGNLHHKGIILSAGYAIHMQLFNRRLRICIRPYVCASLHEIHQ